MQSVGFSVDSGAILIEASAAMKDYLGHDVVGMRMGLDMIRQGLGKIGLRALELNDPELTALLVSLCVLRQSETGVELTVSE